MPLQEIVHQQANDAMICTMQPHMTSCNETTKLLQLSKHNANIKSMGNSLKMDGSVNSARTEATEIEDFESVSNSSIDSFNSSLVSFSEEVRVRYTISIGEFTYEELHSSWYTPKEFNEISRGISKEVKKLEMGIILRDKKYCERGLERFTKEGFQKCFRDKLQALHAVLEEQFNQSEKGTFDENAIAEAYEHSSRRCRKRAIKAGIHDAEVYLKG